MIRVVLDTNAFVSSILRGGKPRAIIDRIIREEIYGGISQALLEEIEDTLTRGKFNFSGEYVLSAISEIRNFMIPVIPGTTVHASKDSDDDRVLECAFEFKADFIVTGDKHLLQIEDFRGIKIVTPADFMEKYAE
jgi:putative PIN family toxin of toxin-antitoxin system